MKRELWISVILIGALGALNCRTMAQEQAPQHAPGDPGKISIPDQLTGLANKLSDIDARLTALEVFTYHGTKDDCSYALYNLRTEPAGFKCRSDKGALYERVSRAGFNEAWKDESGMIWSSAFPSRQFDDAKKFCAGLHASLPETKDFLREYAKDFYKVLPISVATQYWLSTRDGYSTDAPLTTAQMPNYDTFFIEAPRLLVPMPVYPGFSEPSNGVICVSR